MFHNQFLVPDNAILDIFGRQSYLGNQFVIPTVGVTLSTTNETPLTYISNPVTNSKCIVVNVRKVSAADIAVVKYYSNPTISANGTVVTPVNLRPATGMTSTSLSYSGPTVSSNGTLLSALTAPTEYYVTLDNTILIVLDPGQTLLVTAQILGTAPAMVNSEISFYEV